MLILLIVLLFWRQQTTPFSSVSSINGLTLITLQTPTLNSGGYVKSPQPRAPSFTCDPSCTLKSSNLMALLTGKPGIPNFVVVAVAYDVSSFIGQGLY
ncbi:hypothetical protein LR48_Vigan01g154500 [Vigna angularis]|uniref:Uncharacterized protein n=1 Tax=Phaseolus angularis TaxID=3914 RepID=A0A0L9TPC8_PHAAN|nr:hypothetical protein LR48_Vigan01g154500 [Vigna angularis]